MFAIEDSTSSDWAREIRGTASIDSAVIGLRASTSTTSGLNAGASSAINVAPGFIWSSSSSDGALIANTTSACHGVADGRARVDEPLVREVGPFPGLRRDHHVVAQLLQLAHGGRRRRDARLPGLGLAHYTDDHCQLRWRRSGTSGGSASTNATDPGMARH